MHRTLLQQLCPLTCTNKTQFPNAVSEPNHLLEVSTTTFVVTTGMISTHVTSAPGHRPVVPVMFPARTTVLRQCKDLEALVELIDTRALLAKTSVRSTQDRGALGSVPQDSCPLFPSGGAILLLTMRTCGTVPMDIEGTARVKQL